MAQKSNVKTPDIVHGMVRCGNPNCITNKNEPVETEFMVESKDPVVLRCVYCDRIQEDFSERLV